VRPRQLRMLSAVRLMKAYRQRAVRDEDVQRRDFLQSGAGRLAEVEAS